MIWSVNQQFDCFYTYIDFERDLIDLLVSVSHSILRLQFPISGELVQRYGTFIRVVIPI